MEFQGVRPVLHIPFGSGVNQPVRHDELRRLADRMLDADVDGLVVLGLAYEAWTIREEERDEVLATVAAACTGRRPFVVGLDGATAIAVDRAGRAAAAGAAGLMVLPPTGARRTDQLVAHYVALAETAGLPILVQDSPQVTGVTLTVEAIVELAHAHPLLRSLKVEIPGAGAKISACAAAGVEVVAGWGGLQYLDSVRRGASGCMPGCDLGPAIHAIDRRVRSGDGDGADALYRTILPLLSYEAQSLELLLLGAKRLLCRQGVFSSEELRAPARRLDPDEVASLDELFDRLERDRVPGFLT